MKIFLADLVHSFSPAQAGAYSRGLKAGFVVPYGIASIAAYSQKVFGNTDDISLFKFPEDILEACAKCDTPPDVIAFAHYVWNTNLNFAIGTKLRKMFPDALIAIGGPSVQADQKELEKYLRYNKFADVCIINEGERTFAEILTAYKQYGKTFIKEAHPISGTAYFSPERLVYTPNTNIRELDMLPSPYLTGHLDSFLSMGLIPMFETNRGCPFACSYCAWGIATFSKVRQFPIERIFAELDYVAEKVPDASTWFLADANFGIIERDVEIARRMHEIKKNNPALRTIVIFESKNTPDRNYEIAKLLRNKSNGRVHTLDNALIALQTLDPAAIQATNRKNIKMNVVSERIATYHSDGYGVRTDILSGLPGESLEGHLNTLRQVFDFGFDQIGIYNVVLLPGTEMNSRTARETYGLVGKFFTRDGYFGEYNGIRAQEAEEVVCANSAITAEDLMTTRLLHWAIWFGWNHKFLKPIIRYAHSALKKNPADILYALVTGNAMPDFFKTLRDDHSQEFFDSAESLREHYFQESEWNKQISPLHKPANLIHNAKMLKNRELFRAMLKGLSDIVTVDTDPADFDELCRILMLMRIEPDAIYAGNIETQIPISIPTHLVQYFFDEKMELEGEYQDFLLQKTTEEQENIRKSLIANGYAKAPMPAICATLVQIKNSFTYSLLIRSPQLLEAH